MTITSRTVEPGIVAVTVDYPPVNAIPSRGWFDLADAVTEAGRDTATHAVVLRAEGRGFNAGVDIKEMQRTPGFTALIDANRGCFAAFKAVYECAVPVIAAVNGVLEEIGAGTLPQIQVWNKIDATLASPEVQRDACGKITRVLLSARTGEGLDLLRQVLTDVALEHKAALAAASQSPDSD